MRKFFFLSMSMVIITLGLSAQTTEKSVNQVPFSQITFSDPTYITLRGGIGNIEPLRYEVNFAPNFNVEFHQLPNLGFEFSPQIILRMYDQHSNPVRTPSYMPKGTIFYRLQGVTARKIDLVPYLTIGHHSNGQEGDFYNSDSITINKLNGSFSTNYGTLGLIYSASEDKIFNPIQRAGLSFRYYSVYQPVLRSLYGKVRFYGDLESSLSLSSGKADLFSKQESRSQLRSKIHVGWIASDLINAQTFDLKRLIFSWTLSYDPAYLNQISFFARYYYGQDYYNINFERTLSLLQVGLSIRNLGF